MSTWAAAAATINRTFVDPEPIVYTHADVQLAPISAVRIETQGFEHGHQPVVSYEVPQTALPGQPTKRDTFTHRGRRWRIENIVRKDDVGAFELIVGDDGAVS